MSNVQKIAIAWYLFLSFFCLFFSVWVPEWKDFFLIGFGYWTAFLYASAFEWREDDDPSA